MNHINITQEQITHALVHVTLTKAEREMLDEAMNEAGVQAVRKMFEAPESAARMLKYACYIQVTDRWLAMDRMTAIELAQTATDITHQLNLHQQMRTYMDRLTSKLQLMDTPHDD